MSDETALLSHLIKHLGTITRYCEYIMREVYNPDATRYAKEVTMASVTHQAYLKMLMNSCRDVDSSGLYPDQVPSFPKTVVEFYNGEELKGVDECVRELLDQAEKRMVSQTETWYLRELIHNFHGIVVVCDKYMPSVRFQPVLEACFMMRKISIHHLLRLKALFDASIAMTPYKSPLLAEKPPFNQVVPPSIPRCRD